MPAALPQGLHVALRKESVDRNLPVLVLPLLPWWSLSARRAWIEIGIWALKQIPLTVALRKESVDRNFTRLTTTRQPPEVALRKESVDRNLKDSDPALLPAASLSARRAWIEMMLRGDGLMPGMSLSARRAWIEIAEARP